MDKERSMLIGELVNCKEKFQTILELPSKLYIHGVKSAEVSAKTRAKGNDLFLKKQHDSDLHQEIFSHYCESVMAALSNSQELALAYGNRSAFLVHVKRYKECIEDIDKALEITMPEDFKAKLLRRKVECLKKLGIAKHLEAFNRSQHYKKLDKNEYNNEIEELLKVTATDLNNSGTKAAAILPKTDKPLDCVKIKYNEKYGRHLIARKDYNPGDIIFVEDLYATVVSPKFKYTNCHYCLKTAWSGIPCDHCNWATFCSQDCKLKAWKAYHDIECLLISSMDMGSEELYIDTNFTIRLFVLAFKEAGSIEKLKEELAAVEKCSFVAYKGFYSNGEFHSQTLQSILSLKGSDLSDKETQAILQDIPKLLINLIKFTQVLEDFHPKNIDDLIKNEDAVFLGSLLIKLASMKKDYSLSFTPEVLSCSETTCSGSFIFSCTSLGTCLGSQANLINHSCYPNANRFFTSDGKIVIYAQYPIKKNSQIFHQYYGHFSFMTLADRRALYKSHNFDCDCIACISNWPRTLTPPNHYINNILERNERNICQKQVMDECFDISFKFIEGGAYSRKVTVEEIQKMSEVIAKAFKNFKEPITMVSVLEAHLNKAYVAIYGLEQVIFDRCDKITMQPII